MSCASNKGKTESGAKRLGQTQERAPLLTDLREVGQKGCAIDAYTLATYLGLNYGELVEYIENTAALLKELAPDFLAVNFGNGRVQTENGEEIETHVMTPLGGMFVLMGIMHPKGIAARLKLMHEALSAGESSKRRGRCRKR